MYTDLSIFYFVRTISAFDHSYGKGATEYQMQYIFIITISLYPIIYNSTHLIATQRYA